MNDDGYGREEMAPEGADGGRIPPAEASFVVGDADLLAEPDELLQRIRADGMAAGGEFQPDPAFLGSVGATMFDLPSSEDNTVTVLLPKEQAQAAPSQALVRIVSREDGRRYIGVVAAGPFAEPDSLR